MDHLIRDIAGFEIKCSDIGAKTPRARRSIMQFAFFPPIEDQVFACAPSRVALASLVFVERHREALNTEHQRRLRLCARLASAEPDDFLAITVRRTCDAAVQRFDLATLIIDWDCVPLLSKRLARLGLGVGEYPLTDPSEGH
eukprot:4479309-Pyramimonas_sp.AAC.1